MSERGQESDESPQPARVLIVDDHEVLAASLAQVLDHEPDLSGRLRRGTLEKARALIATEAPDVVLLDHRLPDGDGVEAIAGLLEMHPAASASYSPPPPPTMCWSPRSRAVRPGSCRRPGALPR